MWWKILLIDFIRRYEITSPLTKEQLERAQERFPNRWVYSELRTILYYHKIGL